MHSSDKAACTISAIHGGYNGMLKEVEGDAKYLILEIHGEKVLCLVLGFKGLDCFFHALDLSILALTVLFGSANLAEQQEYAFRF